MEKKISISESELKEAFKKAILIHEKKKLVKKIVKEQLEEQIVVAKLCENFLKEGPLTGVWQGLKQGVQTFGGGFKQALAGGHQAFVQAQMQAQAQKQAQQATQAAQKQLQAAFQAVSRAKQKYNQEILKNAQTLNAYHDSVVNLYQTFENVKNNLGPAMQQMSQDVMMTVGQLKSDLTSEKSQIEAFMNQLGQQLPNVDISSLGATATKRQKQRWEDEARESGRSLYGMTRLGPGTVQKRHIPGLQPSIAAQAQQKTQNRQKRLKK